MKSLSITGFHHNSTQGVENWEKVVKLRKIPFTLYVSTKYSNG